MTIQENANTRVRTLAPAVDVFENADEILIVADVPGVPSDAIRVHLDGSQLTLEAQKAGPEPLLLRRSFHVPTTIDGEKIDARAKDGVLRVHVPKRADAKPRRIEVKSEA
jgi:HSP20 family protein